MLARRCYVLRYFGPEAILVNIFREAEPSTLGRTIVPGVSGAPSPAPFVVVRASATTAGLLAHFARPCFLRRRVFGALRPPVLTGGAGKD